MWEIRRIFEFPEPFAVERGFIWFHTTDWVQLPHSRLFHVCGSLRLSLILSYLRHIYTVRLTTCMKVCNVYMVMRFSNANSY